MTNLSYTTESKEVVIDTASYIKNYCNPQRFIEFCKQCVNFGKRYGCPPFDYDPLNVISRYSHVKLIGIIVRPEDKNLHMRLIHLFLQPVVNKLNTHLLDEELKSGGRACGFAGKCTFCGKQPCARKFNQPCRHPENVRPSLEAFGFDISKTAADLLNIEIKWSHNDRFPEYLTLVSAIFFNL